MHLALQVLSSDPIRRSSTALPRSPALPAPQWPLELDRPNARAWGVYCWESHETVPPREAEDTSVEKGSAPWHGAWVGWLTCQVALLLLVESTSLAHQPAIAFLTRVVLVSAFVWAFARPCFSGTWSRGVFLLTTLGVEAALGVVCSRFSNESAWLLLVALGLTALLIQPPTKRSTLWALEVGYAVFARLTRMFALLPQARWFSGWMASSRPDATTVRHLWAVTFEYLERHRQRWAHAVNRRRRQWTHL